MLYDLSKTSWFRSSNESPPCKCLSKVAKFWNLKMLIKPQQIELLFRPVTYFFTLLLIDTHNNYDMDFWPFGNYGTYAIWTIYWGIKNTLTHFFKFVHLAIFKANLRTCWNARKCYWKYIFCLFANDLYRYNFYPLRGVFNKQYHTN